MVETPTDSTTCLIAGGGPAGMMLALLLARAGVDVTVMEKHADFLRDFRGDTVHASTLRILDELGLGAEFARLPHQLIDQITIRIQDIPLAMDLRRLPGDHQHIALVPQWDFLELLAGSAAEEPSFRLMRSTEVLGPIDQDGRVAGVRYRGIDGVERQMRADLTVACDGRGSTLRSGAGLVPRSFGVPIDVWWFRLPRDEGDPRGLNGMFADGHGLAIIDRGAYYQVAFLIEKGTDAAIRAEGIGAFRRTVAEMVGWLAPKVDTLTSFDDVKLLDVQLNRLRTWHTDGMLLIGDAAHAMSPVGGVGINLAIADAVAAARLLAAPLRAGAVSERDLAGVQRRRRWPTVLVQGVQKVVHDTVLAPTLAGAAAPRGVRIAAALPRLRRMMAYGVAIGPMPEHSPAYARRP